MYEKNYQLLVEFAKRHYWKEYITKEDFDRYKKRYWGVPYYAFLFFDCIEFLVYRLILPFAVSSCIIFFCIILVIKFFGHRQIKFNSTVRQLFPKWKEFIFLGLNTLKIFEKIDIANIVVRHFKTLYDFNTKKPCWSEIIAFYILTFLIVLTLIFFYEHSLTEKVGNLLFQAFTTTGCFTTIILVLIDRRKHYYDDSERFAQRLTLIEETYYNISFEIIICFIIALLAGIAVGTSDIVCTSSICAFLKKSITTVIYYLSTIFIHVFLMVLKRLNKIFHS